MSEYPVISRPSMRQIVEDVAERHGFTYAHLTDGRKARCRRALARQEAFWLINKAGFSHNQGARFMGLKDHTSSLHGCRQHERRALAEQGVA